MATETSTHAYHHGDLSSELMARAVEHIARSGTEKLSLRALAREAGVSATAPFRHFPTKRCLLAAIATRGFRQLRERMLEEMSEEADVEQRFFEMGHAYLGFAMDNPVPYQLMFGSVLSDFSDYADLHAAASDSYAVVDGTLAELIETNALDVSVEMLGGAVWSSVHGLASLQIGRKPPVDSQEEEQMPRPLRALQTVRQDLDGTMRVLFSGLLKGSKAP